jgi:uncharacterized protein
MFPFKIQRFIKMLFTRDGKGGKVKGERNEENPLTLTPDPFSNPKRAFFGWQITSMHNPYVIAFKIIEIIGPVLGLSLILGVVANWYLQNSPQQLPIKYKLIQRERTFYLESASLPEELYKGLKFRTDLPNNKGMLFNLGRRHINVGFWMYKVQIPLDIIYLDGGVVTKVIDNVPPCPKQPCPIYYAPAATHVLELRAGIANQVHIQPGVKLKFLPLNQPNLEFRIIDSSR